MISKYNSKTNTIFKYLNVTSGKVEKWKSTQDRMNLQK